MPRLLRVLLLSCVGLILQGCGGDDDPDELEDDTDPFIQSDYSSDGPPIQFGDDFAAVVKVHGQLVEDTASGFGVKHETLRQDSPIFEHGSVRLELSPLMLGSDEVNLQVRKMIASPPVAEARVEAYDFKMPAEVDYPGFFHITIPYDPSGTGADSLVGAGYFNTQTNRWEPVPYTVDHEKHHVVIATNHLSTYASITITGKNTRYARATNLFEAAIQVKADAEVYGRVVKEAMENDMTPGQEAVELGQKIIGDSLTWSGVILTFEGVAYSSDFLSELSDAFGYVGTSMALVQLAYDYSRGDEQIIALNAMKNVMNYKISNFGGKALSVALLGVAAIDYSLNKLATETIKDREDIWERAYRLYYRDKHKRSARDWYKRLRELADHANSPAQFERLLDTELNRYTNNFWTEEPDVLAIYQDQAMKSGFSGGGGLNEKLKTSIADKFKRELLLGTLEPVFRQLERDLRYEQTQAYQQELENLKKKLNQSILLEIQDIANDKGELIHAGYLVQFAPLAEKTDPKQWTGRLDENGYLRASFTVLGHLSAGMPNELRLYKSVLGMHEQKPDKVVKLVLDVPHTKIRIESGETEPFKMPFDYDPQWGPEYPRPDHSKLTMVDTGDLVWFYDKSNDDVDSGLKVSWYDATTRKKPRYAAWIYNGEEHGLVTEWYENGQKKRETYYHEGKRHGLNRSWDRRGYLEYEENYYMGEDHGVHRRYNPDGSLSSEQFYQMGELVQPDE